ncbi:cyclophilin-like domain-containing protein [Geopyxis carbonaria]|nr:cyclophilin-like domain-containing protein [Geopyxis carbonaria]
MSVTIHTTHGPLKLELFCEATPKTCENFLALCASSYFTDVPFHRNIAGFMVQTGDGEKRNGKGGLSIYSTPDAPYFEDEIKPGLRHTGRGVVAMANKSRADTNASQWYITYATATHLDGRNTVFGKVIEGIDTTLVKIEKEPVDAKNRPKSPVLITGVTIHANPIAETDAGD